MKKSVVGLAIAGCFAGHVYAQGSVTLYGIIDAGLNFVNNDGGKQLYQFQSAVSGSRWGIKGKEDLGGGTSAIFQLESGFSPFTGKSGQGGLLFGRQAYVGLTNETFGSLTFGRQYDPLVDLVGPLTFNQHYGALFSHVNDIDNSDDAFRVSNAVKYVSPKWNGFVVEGMYAFGGVAGQFRQNSTVSGGASYSGGALSLAAAYFYARNPATQFPDGNFQPNTANLHASTTGIFGYVGNPSNMQTVGASAVYHFQSAEVGGAFTNARYDDANGVSGNTVWFNSYEVWGQYFFTPTIIAGLGYNFTNGHVHSTGDRPEYHQVNAVADYFLSKRTDVYVLGVFQQAANGAKADIYQVFTGQSTTNRQFLLRVGMRHRF
ncbi:porin [Paraburkholderia sp. MM5477-R1]|uniref:porin n=1 Tax=Paraburkholderia sp. MM5477-R1 TaxID=2991062 RepID=UPI003D23D0D7